MIIALLSIGCALVAAATTHFVLARIVPVMPLRKENYRGIATPTGLGVAVVAGVIAAAGLLGLIDAIAPSSLVVAQTNLTALVTLAAVAGFGLLGLFDDLAASGERGFRAHVGALGAGRLTSGALKLVAGSALALAVAAPGAHNFGYAVTGGAVIALMANLFNALDVRPGRSGKWFLVAAIALAIPGAYFRPALAAGIGAVAAFLPADLRERAMLGDAGSNAIGALAGVGIAYVAPHVVEIIVFVLLAALTVVAEGPTLSKAIDSFGPLRAFDRLGRVPD